MKEIKKYQITKDFSISSIYELGASLFKYKNIYENLFNNKDFFSFLISLDYVRATKIKNLYDQERNFDVFLFKCRYFINPYFKFIFKNQEYNTIDDIDMTNTIKMLPYFDLDVINYLSNSFFSYYLKISNCQDKLLIKRYEKFESDYKLNNRKGYYNFVYSFIKDEFFHYKNEVFKDLKVFFSYYDKKKQLPILIERFHLDEPLYETYLIKNNKQEIFLEYKKLVEMNENNIKKGIVTLKQNK